MNFVVNLLMFLLVFIGGFFAVFVAVGVGIYCAVKEYSVLLKHCFLKIFGREDIPQDKNLSTPAAAK